MYGVSVAEVELGLVYAGPALVGEARPQPRVRLAAGVDRLAVVEVVEHHGRGARRPAFVGDHGLDVAVGELDLQLREGSQLVAVEAPAAAPAQPSAKPAIARARYRAPTWAEAAKSRRSCDSAAATHNCSTLG